jgi:N-acetylneuraminic acid mutarotase
VEGKIYVFGGDPGGGTTLGTSYEYDPASNAWQTKADLPTPRMRHSACAINGKIYVIGGTPHNHGDDVLATVEEYDPATDTWTRKADMPTPRHSLTTSVVDGKIYAIGGAKGSAPFARAVPVRSVEVYEPATDTWEKRKDMPITPEVWEVPTATGVIGGKIYFPRLAATYEYDPATDTWELDRTGMPTPRISTGGAVVNDRFYVIAGYCCDFNASNKESVGLVVEAYDPLTDTWTTRAPMLERVAEFGLAVSEGKIYTFGGYNGEIAGVVSTVEEYTPEGWPFKVTSVSPQGKLSKSWGEIKTAGE